MHMYVDCGTVYDSKHLDSTLIPINTKDVAYIHHGILCSHHGLVHVLCRDVVESGSYPQQTDTRTEN